MKAIITIGCAGAGKTTWAKKYAKENPNTEIIERDMCRRQIAIETGLLSPSSKVNFWTVWNWKLEPQVTKLQNSLIDIAFESGKDLILSDTNLNNEYRQQLVERLELLGYNVSFEYFDVPYKKLLKQDNQRVDSVGQQVIARHFTEFNEIYHRTTIRLIEESQKDFTKPKALVFDIDGTLAHMDRSKRSPYEWDKVGLDDIDVMTADILRTMQKVGYKIIILSGRDGSCHDQTVEWLSKYNIKYDEIGMRGEGDTRADFDVKMELIKQVIPNYHISAVFDDRPQVCRLWNILGFKVYQIGNQHLEF